MMPFLVMLMIPALAPAQAIVRVNQVGFLPLDRKTAIVLFREAVDEPVGAVILSEDGKTVFSGRAVRKQGQVGDFLGTYEVDFTPLAAEGSYTLRINGTPSASFSVKETSYERYLETPLEYLREQRCGYNPVFDTVCHQKDGVIVNGPDDGTRIDATGGYHDASDYLRFLITTSYVVGNLLFTYQEYPSWWSDCVDARGKRGGNGLPDILDEARWGLEWMLKLAPGSGRLYHQVADDRDHAFWDLPFRDETDYGWGKGMGRPVYTATGVPQGLFAFKNTSSGISNIAGRSAAAFALGSLIWKDIDSVFSSLLRSRAVDLYEMGTSSLGWSESVPGKAPYRYHEKTYYDDLEWAAAELYRNTGNHAYLADAVRFADLAADTSWMGKDTTHHYEYFPYVNLGHYELFRISDAKTKERLAEYYRRGLEAVRRRGASDPFGYGVPFIWVSNNLATGLLTQAILYKKMTGSREYNDVLFDTRDWLFGRNPWGQAFVIGVPAGGSFPKDPHSVVGKELGLELTGALVDGPVSASIFQNLKGLRLNEPDEFAPYQSSRVVYHDDVGDYSTNEPTLDGSEALLFILASFAGKEK